MANLSDLTALQKGLGGFNPQATLQAVKTTAMNAATSTVNEATSKLKEAAQSIPGVSGIKDTLSNAQNTLSSYGLGVDTGIFKDTPIGDWVNSSDVFNSFDLSANENATVRYKVRLVSVLGLANAFTPGDIGSVIFEVTPSFTESGSVEYSSVQPVHMPGSIQVYKYTHARTFNITAHFISRNTADALKNIDYLQTLRSWRYPFFGNSGTTNATKPAGASIGQYNGPTPEDKIRNSTTESNAELLGAPPEVLYLYAYSTSANDKRDGSAVNINRVPVVLTSLNISYPEDVDYLPVSLSTSPRVEPFPVKMDVQITLTESHSPTEYERFDLMSYKLGTLRNF